MNLTRRFKGYFLHGLAVLLPSILTIWLFVWGYSFIQTNISRHLNRGLVHLIALAAHENVEISDNEIRAYLRETRQELKENPEQLEIHSKREEIKNKAKIWKLKGTLAKTWVDGPGSIVGFLIAVIGVCILGALLASYVGKTLWRRAERFMLNTPLLRRVYPYIKQVTDFLLTDGEQKRIFSRVVAVEYPRKGIWSLGFVTGSGFEKVVSLVRREFLTIFIPTSPTPLTGFVITIPKKQVIDLDMTIEEAFRFVVSGGVIAPGTEHAMALLRPEAEKGIL
ncbi:MAG: hypothetical protein A2Z25_08120 [Planctomycetes bacterium RBG_16_55_9]|nr:MAG: hypothetical protein A2Z25_08120 [Planctomycetes bacterium RBG_16_55_9]